MTAPLRRSDPGDTGMRRRRCGRGFSYLGSDAVVITDPRTLARIRHDVTAADINDYLREISAGDYTAKDFRTWHATVLAAAGLAVSESAAGRDSARKRAVTWVVQEVAEYLGNTPAVARASYIDPRVIDRYEAGHTIASALGALGQDCHFGDLATRGRAEAAVVKLLARDGRAG